MLVLLSAGTAESIEQRRDRLCSLSHVVDWERLGEVLRRGRLLTLLGPRLIDLAPPDAVDGLTAAVQKALQETRRHAGLQQAIADRVRERLTEAGIRSTQLKGPALSERLYGDPGRRSSSDIDLLVAVEDLWPAAAVAEEMGYVRPTDHLDRYGRPLLHLTLTHPMALPPLELHWRIHWYEESFARERMLPPASDGPSGWTPDDIDQLCALLLYYARDGFMNLRQAIDLAAWWDRCGARLPQGALPQRCEEHPALERVLLVSAQMASTTVGLPCEQLLHPGHRLGRRGRLATRLAQPRPAASEAQINADMGLIDGLLAPPGSLRSFVRRQLMPPRSVLRERASSSGAHRRRTAAGHCLSTLGRYGLTTARALTPYRVCSSLTETFEP